MYSITFLPILLLVISIPHMHSLYENTPIIAITQGVIENDDLLPISVYWYMPKFTEVSRLVVHFLKNQTKTTCSAKIESHTGFYDLPRTALAPDGSPDKYCAVIHTKQGIMNIIPACESKIQWMYDRREDLGSFSLRNLIIPGTHESAAYEISDAESWSELHSSWIFCQTKSIKTQLMDGIRYLDLRPGLIYWNGRKEFITTHGTVHLVSMDDVVKQINEFMELSKDIVIVSFKGSFPGFHSDEDHVAFINYLEFSFEKYVHPRAAWIYTLNQFWSADKRLILSYDHDLYRSSHYMWPPINQYWSDAQTINQLHRQLDAVHKNHVNDVTPYAAMVQFTYSTALKNQNVFSSDMNPRNWAERLKKYIPRWYVEEWSSMVNIIVVDFYQTSSIIDIAIQLNEKRMGGPVALPIIRSGE